MLRRSYLLVLLLAACEPVRGAPPSSGPRSAPRDGGGIADGQPTADDGSDGLDGGELDAGGFDSGFGDAGASNLDSGGLGFDAAAHADAGGPRDAGAPRDAGLRDSGSTLPDSGPPPPPAGSVSLRTSGCSADFGGDIFVAYNGSLGIASLRGPSLTASLQFDLRGLGGNIALSSNQRIQTGLVVNLVTWSTWTNIAQDSAVYTGMAPDPIGGTLAVHSYDPASGIADIELFGVTLQNVSDNSLCTLDGRAHTTRLGR